MVEVPLVGDAPLELTWYLRRDEKLRAAAPKEKVVIDEGDLDIFS